MDYQKLSHVDPGVNEKLIIWLEEQYDGEFGSIKATRRKKNNY